MPINNHINSQERSYDTNYEARVYHYRNWWYAEYPDLPNYVGKGRSPQEAISNGQNNMLSWLNEYYKKNGDLPKPKKFYAKEYKGKIHVRMSKSLHRELVFASFEDGTTLNQLCNRYLAEGLENRKKALPFNTAR